MKVSDDLRAAVNMLFLNGSNGYNVLMDLADRIDAEMVELPKDADGEYIHIGDRMENNERVARIVLTDDSWEPSVYLEKLPNVLHEYFCNEVSHYHAPSVEDVLREFAYGLGVPVADSYVAAAATKLRLAEGVDE